MKYHAVMDLHTHTLASGHAYCTIKEMAKAASEKGLEMLGITEHAPEMPGSCHSFYFHNLKVVPREMYGIRLMLGTELNILDEEGHIDLNERDLKEMDVVIASLHTTCFRPGTMEENTRACLNVMKNPCLHILGHPDDGRYALDYRALVEGAKEYGKILELNNHSLEPTSFRRNARENDICMLELCREYKVPVIMSSDAHFDNAIGEFTCARALLEELKFPEDLVINTSVDRLMGYLNKNLK
jgi:putative hydrolase